MATTSYQPGVDERRVLSAAVSVPGNRHAAIIRCGDRWLVARQRPEAGPLGSAVLRLVLGVYESLPGAAHATLRGRILTSTPRTRLDHEVVKVAAGKLSAAVDPLGRPLAGARIVDVGDAAGAAVVRAIRDGPLTGRDRPAGEERAAYVRREVQALPDDAAAPPHARHRRVVAAAYGPDGMLLGAARNLNGRNRVLHAEVVLLLAWWSRERRLLPPETRVVTSLKPCRMCAAALVAATDGGRPEVAFLEDDPGRYARATVLDGSGLLHRDGSAGSGD